MHQFKTNYAYVFLLWRKTRNLTIEILFKQHDEASHWPMSFNANKGDDKSSQNMVDDWIKHNTVFLITKLQLIFNLQPASPRTISPLLYVCARNNNNNNSNDKKQEKNNKENNKQTRV